VIRDDLQVAGHAIGKKVERISHGHIPAKRAQKIIKIFITTIPLASCYCFAPWYAFVPFWVMYEVIHIRSETLDWNLGLLTGGEAVREWYFFGKALLEKGLVHPHLITALVATGLAIYYLWPRCKISIPIPVGRC
jgi:hypothetical protein